MTCLPPGGLHEIVFAFDTTGSLSSIIEEVTAKLQDMLQRLQADIPGIRMTLVAHGDFFLKNKQSYDTRFCHLTSDITELCTFVTDSVTEGGRDSEKKYTDFSYEYISNRLQWTSGSQRALVTIGDSQRHEPDYFRDGENKRWREELKAFVAKDVKIYSVQAFSKDADAAAVAFYKGLADQTEGQYIKLGDFSNITQFIMAICYREQGAEFLEGYEKELRANVDVTKGLNKDLEGMFGQLKRVDSSQSTTSRSKAKPAINAKVAAIKKVNKGNKATSKIKTVPAKKTPLKREAVKVERKKSTPKRSAKKTVPVKRPLREKVPETKFLLNHMTWSPWRLVVTPEKPLSNDGAGFWRKRSLYKPTTSPTLFEVAVQTKPRGKRMVVFCKLVQSVADSQKWVPKLLRSCSLKIDSVVKKGYKIFIRRAVIGRRSRKNLQKSRNLMKLYDYAWSKQKGKNVCQRL